MQAAKLFENAGSPVKIGQNEIELVSGGLGASAELAIPWLGEEQPSFGCAGCVPPPPPK